MHDEDLLRVGWLLVVLGSAYGFLRLRRRHGPLRRLVGAVACLLALVYLWLGVVVVARTRYSMVYDAPDRDDEVRLGYFLLGALTVLGGASSLYSGVSMLIGIAPPRPPPPSPPA